MGIKQLRLIRVYGKKATRPCPCGYAGDPSANCRCSTERIFSYRQKISGPLLDRIDIVVAVPRLSPAELTGQLKFKPNEEDVRKKISNCRHLQLSRNGKLNSVLQGRELESICSLEPAAAEILNTAVLRLRLSARAYHRVLRLARTIADYEAHSLITRNDISEAISYRGVDSSTGVMTEQVH